MMVAHFQTFCKSLKITWVKKYISEESNDSQWYKLVNYSLRDVREGFVHMYV